MMKRKRESFFSSISIALLFGLMLSGCSLLSEEKQKKELHLLWEYEYSNSWGYEPNVTPLVIDDHSIITSGDRTVTSLDVSTGAVNWKQPINYESSLRNREFALRGEIIAGTTPGKVIAWDINTGRQSWRVILEDPSSWNYGESEIASFKKGFMVPGTSKYFYFFSDEGIMDTANTDLFLQKATIDNDIIFAAQKKEGNLGVVSAYDLESMNLLWRYNPNKFGYTMYFPPVLNEGLLYVFFNWSNPTPSGTVALNAQNGEVVWRQNELSALSTIIRGDVIYGTNYGYVWAADKHTGEFLWKSNDVRAGTGYGSIAYLDGYLYATFYRGLLVLDAETGEINALMKTNPGEGYQLVTADAGRIFAQSDRKLYAFAPWGYEEPLE